MVYAVEFSHRSGRDLVNMAKKRTNVIPIIADARKPLEYRVFVGMVDVVFADVAQPDQARIMGINCQYFLKNGGHFVISIKVNIIKILEIFVFFCNSWGFCENYLRQIALIQQALLLWCLRMRFKDSEKRD